jgi:Cu-processing system permease protein
MLKMDVSALMGYTGALYKDVFGNFSGTLYTIGILAVWMLVPVSFALKAFKTKDM